MEWLAGWGGGPGEVVWGGGPGRVAGRVWWRARGGGGRPGGQRGMDLWGKECSGVNMVT